MCLLLTCALCCSTVSTGLNSLAAIWFSELDGTDFKAKLTERQRGLTVKMLALGFGLLSFALVFLVPFMGGLAPVAIALSSFFSGALFGLFLLGMFVPFANAVVSSARGQLAVQRSIALSGITVTEGQVLTVSSPCRVPPPAWCAASSWWAG